MKEKKELKNRVEISEEKAVQALDQPDYIGEILSLIRSNTSPIILREKLDDYHENDIADALPQLQPNERQKLYRILDPDLLAAILEYAEEDEDALYLSEMDIHRAASVVSEMDSDDAVSVLKTLPKERRALVIDLMDSDSKHDIKLMASYDDDEIGSRMTTNCIIIRENLSVKEAMSELVRQAGENDNISTLFTVDEDGEFYGAIDLKELIIARGDQSLDDLIVTSFPYVYGHEEIDDCIEYLKDYSEDSIPVLDRDKKLLGIITSQDIVEVVDEEMSEDYAKLAGLSEEEDLDEPLTESIKKRIPWLIILLIMGLGVSTITGLFEPVMVQLTLLVSFQSVILGMSGNVGTQSLGVTIRVLANDDDLESKDIRHLVFKEIKIGLSNGAILGSLTLIFIGFFILFAKGETMLFAFSVSACIGLALMVAMGISSFTGTMIPIILKKFGLDPAVASGPLITTMNDLVAVVTYYGTAWILLINMLHLG